MDERQERINQAAQQLADALVQAYRILAEHGTMRQELNAELTEQFFNRVIDHLQSQMTDHREMTQALSEQQQRGEEASHALAQESVVAYTDFVSAMFAYFRATPQATQKGAG